MKTALTIVLALIGGALILLIYNHQAGRTLGLANDDFASFAYLAILGAVIAAGVVGAHQRLGEMLRNALIWLVVILGLAAAWIYKEPLREFASALSAGLVPTRPVIMATGDGPPAISIRKSLGGHYEVEGAVNATPVRFLIDTGATTLTLSHEDAIAVGFADDGLAYTAVIHTANGTAMAAPVRIGLLEIGPLRRVGLRALVAEPGKLDRSLLGMNFIASLSSFELRGDEAILRD